MGLVITVMIVLGICFFVFDSFRYFMKVDEYKRQNGYIDETICYIKSPYVNHSESAKVILGVCNWFVKIFVSVIWISSVILVIRDKNFGYALLASYIGYLIVFFWYQIYSVMNGVKILESGIANGMDKIHWKKIEKYSISVQDNKLNRNQKTFLKMKCSGQFINTHIEITTENKELVRRLFIEKCLAYQKV